MPFRQASGREKCVICRTVLASGATVYVGERTPLHWCASCAAEGLSRTPDGPVPASLGVSGMAGLREGLAELARKHQWQAPPTWTERD